MCFPFRGGGPREKAIACVKYATPVSPLGEREALVWERGTGGGGAAVLKKERSRKGACMVAQTFSLLCSEVPSCL